MFRRVFALASALLGAIAVTTLPTSRAVADSIRDQEWHLAFLDVERAQKISDGRGVTIAIIDSGVDASHPDLVGNVLPGVVTYAGVDRKGDAWQDRSGHGTGMAGDIVSHGHGVGRGDGALGIAPGAKILPIADTSDSALGGTGVTDALVAGIDYAVSHNALVISISESVALKPTLVAAVERAQKAGIVIVAAAGNRNDGDLTVAAPASLPGVIAAASVDQRGVHAADSVAGAAVLLSAPGVKIVHPAPGGGYAEGTGTSDATAIVAGAVALVRAKYPNLSAAEVIHRLTATATDKGPPGRDNEYGYGVINIVAALTADVPPLSASPSTAPSATDQSPSRSAAVAQPAGPGTALLIVIPIVAVLCALIVMLIWWAVRHRTP